MDAVTRRHAASLDVSRRVGERRPDARRLVAVVMVVATILGSASPGAADGSELYRPPVDAPVIDPFRPPDQPWLPGNRGLEYDTAPGTVVGAIGPGLVVFAGPVAGQLYVTVLHPDGIRSSYSYLAAISVVEGDRVHGGQTVGITSGVPFHLGARIGATYIDPASLFGTRPGRASVFLVPLDGSPPPGASPAPVRASPAIPPGGVARGSQGTVGSVGTTIDDVVHGLAAALDRVLAPTG